MASKSALSSGGSKDGNIVAVVASTVRGIGPAGTVASSPQFLMRLSYVILPYQPNALSERASIEKQTPLSEYSPAQFDHWVWANSSPLLAHVIEASPIGLSSFIGELEVRSASCRTDLASELGGGARSRHHSGGKCIVTRASPEMG